MLLEVETDSAGAVPVFSCHVSVTYLCHYKCD